MPYISVIAVSDSWHLQQGKSVEGDAATEAALPVEPGSVELLQILGCPWPSQETKAIALKEI